MEVVKNTNTAVEKTNNYEKVAGKTTNERILFMRILFILLGSFSILYFIGIVLYAGLSSLFPCIWAAAGIVCYAIAILLQLETTHHWNILSIFPKPVKAVWRFW